MPPEKLEKRVAALEAELAILKARINEKEKPTKPWWEEIAGSFEGDPYFEEAMKLGRKYRESQRPKPKKKAKK
jgi:hypothetical protein